MISPGPILPLPVALHDHRTLCHFLGSPTCITVASSVGIS
jgi:hypothetical protein